MATITKPTRDEKVNLRLPGDLKRTIEDAAALAGQTVSAFILGVVAPRARKVVAAAKALELSDRDARRFLAALDDAEAEPSPALARAAERYKRAVG